jgi:NAD(P) transhydrogenase subunit alpha
VSTDAAITPSPGLTVAVPREREPGERRVALVPSSVPKLIAAGIPVAVEGGAGVAAGHPDQAYADAGARVVDDPDSLFGAAGPRLFLCVNRPGEEQAGRMPARSALVGLLRPTQDEGFFASLASRGVDAFSLELLPRITRAQEMDALSSMSTVSGYHATLMAATRLPRFLPMLMTAAGTIRPARVLVIGAGVAGLQAIATARRLGAVVEAFDVRAAAREQVTSLGARFIDVGVEVAETGSGYAQQLSSEGQRHEREVLARHVADADAVITTALVPGRRAPQLITREMATAMRPGSVIVDVAAEAGGNCELTQPGREVEVAGVLICGPTDLPSRMAADASQLYSHNVVSFTLHLVRDGEIEVDLEDEIIAATCLTRHREAPRPDAPARHSAMA